MSYERAQALADAVTLLQDEIAELQAEFEETDAALDQWQKLCVENAILLKDAHVEIAQLKLTSALGDEFLRGDLDRPAPKGILTHFAEQDRHKLAALEALRPRLERARDFEQQRYPAHPSKANFFELFREVLQILGS